MLQENQKVSPKKISAMQRGGMVVWFWGRAGRQDIGILVLICLQRSHVAFAKSLSSSVTQFPSQNRKEMGVRSLNL